MPENYMAHIRAYTDQYINHGFASKRRYIDYFFSLTCAPELMLLKVFPDAKEVTESLSAYRATQRKLDVKSEDKVIHVIADGSTPRTGALFAFLTKWTIFSIDPQMKDAWVTQSAVDRLCCIRDCIENVYLDLPKPDLLVLVHPHVTYELIRSLYPDTPMIVIPCCVQWPIEKSVKNYTDHGIWSPKNEVLIYSGDKI